MYIYTACLKLSESLKVSGETNNFNLKSCTYSEFARIRIVYWLCWSFSYTGSEHQLFYEMPWFHYDPKILFAILFQPGQDTKSKIRMFLYNFQKSGLYSLCLS